MSRWCFSFQMPSLLRLEAITDWRPSLLGLRPSRCFLYVFFCWPIASSGEVHVHAHVMFVVSVLGRCWGVHFLKSFKAAPTIALAYTRQYPVWVFMALSKGSARSVTPQNGFFVGSVPETERRSTPWRDGDIALLAVDTGSRLTAGTSWALTGDSFCLLVGQQI